MVMRDRQLVSIDDSLNALAAMDRRDELAEDRRSVGVPQSTIRVALKAQ
jgi:hypothetical protein